MISVQNRLPEPGKENRVSITPDSGSPIEGVLAYADNASQKGTFWNRSTAQLLQGDIRTYPVRDGQSISAGDVVNVGREIVSGTTYGDLAVGSTVQINENGSPVDYLVVHQGNPDPNLYDESCNGTWLLRKDIAENRVWDAGNVNTYADSDINAYLNGDWLDRYDSTTLGNIKTVKIPYCVGGGSTTVNSGANGLSVKAFLLGGYEVGWTTETSSYFPVDGAKLSYFDSGIGSSANNKRISNYNSIATDWRLRSPRTSNTDQVWFVYSNGLYGSYDARESYGVRPAFILDSSAYIDAPVYGPETVYKDVVAQDNVEKHYSTASGGLYTTSACDLNESYAVVGTSCWQNVHARVIDKHTGSQVTGALVITEDNIKNISLDRLDDSHFLFQYRWSSLYAKVCTINGTNLTAGSQYTIASSVSDTPNKIVALSSTLALSVYNSSGLKVKVLPISGTTITTSGTAYPLSGNTGANYISACRLPDVGGNKRVCICFSDTGDGNKGKAVIATIDSSNAVTFGSVVSFDSTAISGSGAAIACCENGGDVVVFYTVSNAARDMVLSVSGTTITANAYRTVKSATSNYISITDCGTYCMLFYNDANGKSVILNRTGTTLTPSTEYQFNAGTTRYISAANIGNRKLLVAYSDTTETNDYTTTILTVEGNQIAGSFIDNSSDAIALADGTGGQSIPVGFGGYCECPGVTEGDTIDSSGVWAYSPDDGWLKIVDEREKRVITGTFTTGQAGTTNSVNLGFKPSVVMVYDYNNNTNTSSIPGASGSQANTMNCIRIIATETGNTKLTDTGFDIVLNVLKPLWYVAWR